MEQAANRRERKKAITRQAIADAALRLFLDRGYEVVGIREVAEEADVAVTTLFAHFPSKESLVFQREEEMKQLLLGSVTDRDSGGDLMCKLRRGVQMLLEHSTAQSAAPVWRLVDASPSLQTYEGSMRVRHADALAGAIATELDASSITTACRLIARFAMDAYALARTSTEPHAVMGEAFEMIQAAWKASGLTGREDFVRDRTIRPL